jgi:hypothetical protein
MTAVYEINVFQEKLKTSIAEFVDSVAVELYRLLVENTPKDTGRASSNWNCSVGAPDGTVTENTSPASVTSFGNIPEGQDVVLYIANYLSYIYPLEHGHSNQAPSGMVLVSLEELKLWVAAKLA